MEGAGAAQASWQGSLPVCSYTHLNSKPLTRSRPWSMWTLHPSLQMTWESPNCAVAGDVQQRDSTDNRAPQPEGLIWSHRHAHQKC